MTFGKKVLTRCAHDRGIDTYSQALRDRPGYSDCSWYLRRVYLEECGIDIGTYTTAITEDVDGRDVTRTPAVLRSGEGLQDGDVVLWGWATDHRPGYPYSHVGVYSASERGTWDQYGDVPPHNGPNFHPVGWGLGKADRILVRRFLPDEVPGVAAPLAAVTVTASGSRLSVDGDFGPQTRRAMQRWLKVPADGIIGKATSRALQARLGVRVDGHVGPVTVRALQQLIGARVDGDWGPDTTRHLQTWLNAQR